MVSADVPWDDRSMKQISFSSAEYAGKKRQTRREKFLGDMERVVPWARLIALIEPHYPLSGRVGRPPIGVPRMQRMYFLQQWYGLSDEGLEDAIYDSQAMREFVGIDLSRERVPDATTLLRFRRKLEDNQLTKAIFDEVNAHLGERGLLMREGTMVDATIIAAPPSTKNKEQERDPEMHQTRKGNRCLSARCSTCFARVHRRAVRTGPAAPAQQSRPARVRRNALLRAPPT